MDPFRNAQTREEDYQLELEQREFLFRWFGEVYFDPIAEEASGIHRSYRWMPGDMVDPLEELQSAFHLRARPHILREVANELSRQTTNWRMRPDELDNADRTPEGRASRVGDVVESRLRMIPEELQRDILERISALEVALAVIPLPSPHYGHNNPPESLDELPATKTDVDALRETLQAIRTEVQVSRPSAETLADHKSTLINWGKKVAAWFGARTTKFVDEAVASAGKVAGPTIVLAIAGVLPQIGDLTSAIEKAVQYLTS